MQRRRKKKANAAAKRPGGPGIKLDKSLPSLPPSMEETRSIDETPSEAFAEIAGESQMDSTPEQAAAGKQRKATAIRLFTLEGGRGALSIFARS